MSVHFRNHCQSQSLISQKITFRSRGSRARFNRPYLKRRSLNKVSSSANLFLPLSSFCKFIASCIGLFAFFFISIVNFVLKTIDFATYVPERKEVNYAFRLSIVAVGVLLCSVMVVNKLLEVQAYDRQKWVKLAASQQDSAIRIQGARGSIYDRNGRVLAASVESVSVGVHPRFIKDSSSFSEKISPVLTMPVKEIQKRINSSRRFVWLQRGLARSKRLELEALKLPGLSLHAESKRYYPQGDLASPIVGRVNTDGKGLSGIELAQDKNLGASMSKVAVLRGARGGLFAKPREENLGSNRLLHFVGLKNYTDEQRFEPEEHFLRDQGKHIYLTIDSLVQKILEEEVENGFIKSKARYVSAITMDAVSGEILGAAQYPRFNPNLEKVKSSFLRDRIIQDNFEPGSTMKPLVAAMALEQGLVRANEIMDCENGFYRVGPHTIRDIHPLKKVPLSEVLVRSSNICMAKIGRRLGKEKLYSALKLLGFGDRTGIELIGESRGILRNVKRWAKVDVATHSFGQGMAVTALQMIRSYAAIANGGILLEPTIIRGAERAKPKRIMKEQTAKEIFNMLVGVTASSHGTGKKAAIAGLDVAGKTGTAQKPHLSRRGYDPERVVASFIGMVDTTSVGVDRKLVTLVVVDEPGVKPRWGGAVAGPVFKKSMQRIISHLMTSEGNTILQTAKSFDKHYG